MADISPSLSLLVAILLQLGMGLAVGSSTFAVIFYFKAKRDGVIDAKERSFLHIVYRVLRIALSIIVLSLIILSLSAYQSGVWPYFATSTYWLFWIIIAVIIVNALLMDWHLMPMNLGPAIAAGSWYTLYLTYTLRMLGIDFLPLPILLVYYALFLVFMVFFLRLVDHIVMLDSLQQESRKHPGGNEPQEV
ncbi:MAG: hypothetical protein KatS3mg100_409 [Candidatus Parcubacteria bacterium]|nr:MAG: hypothetical protein KatS3mg100_409 [Candidatus Parcubacteria bacterium]